MLGRPSTNQRIKARRNYLLCAAPTELPCFGTRHASVRVPDGDVDTVVHDAHALDVCDCFLECAERGRLDAGTPDAKCPCQKPPRELGVSRFVSGYPAQDALHVWVARELELFGRH